MLLCAFSTTKPTLYPHSRHDIKNVSHSNDNRLSEFLFVHGLIERIHKNLDDCQLLVCFEWHGIILNLVKSNDAFKGSNISRKIASAFKHQQMLAFQFFVKSMNSRKTLADDSEVASRVIRGSGESAENCAIRSLISWRNLLMGMSKN